MNQISLPGIAPMRLTPPANASIAGRLSTEATARTNPTVVEQPYAASRSLFWIAVAVVAIAFFSAKYEVLTTPNYEFNTEATELEAVGSEGRVLTRGLSYCLLGAFGVWTLTRRQGPALAPRGPLVPLMVAFTAWSLLSIAWSEVPLTSFMRWTQLAICFVAGLGLVRQLSSSDLRLLTLVVSLVYVGIGLAAELSVGGFRPWSGDYRFAGGVHPNSQAQYCATLCLAAIAMIGQPGWPTRRSLFFLLVGGTLCVLTGSRTVCFGLVIAMFAYWALSLRPKVKFISSLGLVCAGCLLALALSLGNHEGDSATTGRLFNVSGDMDSLTGRVPLWTELMTFVDTHPLTGFGYGGFWTVEHKAELFSRLYWIPPSAHNTYLEIALNIGWIGVALMVLPASLGWMSAWKRFVKTHDSNYAYLFALMTFSAIDCLAESLMVIPVFMTFIAGLGMVHLAMDASPRGSTS